MTKPKQKADPLELPEVSDDVDDVLAEETALEGAEFPDEAPITTHAPAPAAPVFEFVPEPNAAPTAHALDKAAVNSKIVVVRSEGRLKAVLASPDGVSVLPPDDIASKLPEGACIQKLAADRYDAIQLSPSLDYPVLRTTTATDAITQFVPHFHRKT